MKKFRLIFFVGLLLLVIWLFFDFIPNWNQRHIPSNIRAIAEKRIASVIGENNVKNNFVYDQQESYVAKTAGYPTDYSVGYHYLPLRKYSDYDVITVRLKDTNIESIIGVPYCSQDQTKCDFNLSKNDALDIARKNGFNSSDLKVG